MQYMLNEHTCFDVPLVYFVDSLAVRLESEGEGEYSMYAGLCYVCSGNVEKLVENWHRNTEAGNAPLSLQVQT